MQVVVSAKANFKLSSALSGLYCSCCGDIQDVRVLVLVMRLLRLAAPVGNGMLRPTVLRQLAEAPAFAFVNARSMSFADFLGREIS